MWLLLFRGSSGEVSRERNTDFGGRNLAFLSGQRLLLQEQINPRLAVVSESPVVAPVGLPADPEG